MELGCKRLCVQNDGTYLCSNDGVNQQSQLVGCHSKIDIPSAEKLLSKEKLDDQTENIDKVKQAIKSKHATLVLGAGVSIPVNMPDWVGLVSRMSGYAFQYQDYKGREYPEETRAQILRIEKELILGKLKILNGVNVLEAAQYVLDAIGSVTGGQSGNEVIKEVISAIIDNSEKPCEFLKSWQEKHPDCNLSTHDLRSVAEECTLSAVAYLLQMPEGEGLRRVLTYNYDTLVQEYLISLFGVSEDRIITHVEGWTTVNSYIEDPIEVFHLHGCVPRPELRNRPPAFPDESEQLILSEDSYYDTERYEAYNWQNSIQSYHMNRDNCIFVGFSADDYNFRRILRQLGSRTNNRPKHYLILTIDQLARDIWESVCQSHITDNTMPEELRKDTIVLLNRELDMKEIYWHDYGFYPIWVTIQDIPKLLLSFSDDSPPKE